MEPRSINWLNQWDSNATKPAREAYVRDELARIIAAGEPPLLAVLTLPLLEQQDLALSVLKSLQPVTTVRLAEGAKPPACDPYGRELPPEKRGVLVAKTATHGSSAGAEQAESMAWSGVGRIRANRPGSRQPLYDVVEIGVAPVALPTQTAADVMRQWGHGVRPDQWRGRAASRRDMWLVVENLPCMLPQQPAKGARAA